MASNNYYYGEQPPRSTPSPYYAQQPYGQQSQSSLATPPSYHSGYPSADPGYGSSSGAGSGYPTYGHTGPSPFDTVFDDNVYPARPGQAASSAGDISQQSPYYDTTYKGQDSRPHLAEDIPLQDRQGKDPEMNDHVYDDPNGGHPKRRSKKRAKVRFGELGMLGSDKKGIPWVCYILSIAQIAVFIGELVKNGLLTGSPIMIKPSFNPFIGPSPQVLINMGARYVPCMGNTEEIQGSEIPILFICPNATSNDQDCSLSELCGFGGVPNPKFNGDAHQDPRPNQWFRFILPIFMHAGVVHIGFNLLLQLTLAREMEQVIGSIRFAVVYFSAGIFGFVMGANFAAPGVASTGCSGSLFGILALTLLDLLYSWKDRKSPVKDLLFVILDMVISFVLGLLPGLDNFSHIGGFLMGLALGICVLHSPNSLRRRMGQDSSYAAVSAGADESVQPFIKNPMGFFKGRKPLWWAWWLVRAAVLIAIIVIFIVLLNSFYKNGHTCEWCKYLSCLPVKDWCDAGTIVRDDSGN